jgi:hypothetical protein
MDISAIWDAKVQERKNEEKASSTGGKKLNFGD